MDELTRQRLLGFRHAFDDPLVGIIVGLIVALLLLSLAAIVLLAQSDKISPTLKRELAGRMISWFVIVPAIVVPILLGAAWFMAVILALSLLSYREFARAVGLFREKVMSLMVVLGILVITFAVVDHWYHFFVAIPPLWLAIIALVAILADRPKGYVQRVGLAVLAFLFFAVCLGHLAYLANDTHYRALVLLLLLAVQFNDVAAYVTGKSLGGPKLAPHTSPNKTIAGSVGAIVLTTPLVFILGAWAFPGDSPMQHPIHRLILGLIISVSGQAGDLMVSSIKRDVGIKDMGNLIPGHGGILDRTNSLLLASPAVFHYIGYYQGVGLDQPTRIITG
ncbi:MAG: phosphatidate cytidylyltransferase [Phycisphaeraceae bacterium]